MGKRKTKPLLVDQGILHLKSCFVHPSEESGLLTTVGGRKEQPLVLASGTYGYGIPMTVAIKAAETAQNKADEEVDPDIQIVREINGGVFSAVELSKDRSGKEVPLNDEEMTVGELVRSIGGARDTPLRKCDVVEDRASELNKKDSQTKNSSEENEEDPQAEEFYASLGIPNPNEKPKDMETEDDEKNLDEKTNLANSTSAPVNVTDGIRDFYKSYTQYYYSQHPNPYGDNKLEFSAPIEHDENSHDGTEQTIIQLARMAQMRARQAKSAADALEKAKRAKALTTPDIIENEVDIYDPLPMEVVPSQTADELGITVDTTLDQYWEFVKDDPHDFNRWIYLIHYAENKNNIAICRKVYSAFLPLFSYCFGYWKRYSDMEKKFNYFGRSLTILERGLEFIPLSVELWKSYITLFSEINSHDKQLQFIVREQYEKALNTCGMKFRSDSLWEAYIQWEIENKRLKKAFSLYGRILQVPTRLFNRHWDNFQVLVRDHHPRDFLEKDEYEYLRKKGCKKLGLRYKEEPEYEIGEIIKPSKPEDKLMVYVKENILKKLTKVHVKCEEESEKRWVYEDRIRRPYFHTKPLDKYQLRNWEEYLNFELAQGDHDRIVLLFERCMIACALYESFWCKYARYLEQYHKRNPSSNTELSVHFLKNQENVEIGSKQDTEEEEKRIKDSQSAIDFIIKHVEREERKESQEIINVLQSVINQIALDEMTEKNEVFRLVKSVIVQVIGPNLVDLAKLSDRFFMLVENYFEKVASIGYIEATEEIQKELFSSPKLIGDSESSVLPVSSGDEESFDNDNSSPGFSTLLSVPEFPPTKFSWQEAVRDVYKRACIVHCPKKPAVRLQWAAFEEELGNSQQAIELVQHCLVWFPDHLEAKLFVIETQRRFGDFTAVSKLFEKYLAISRRVNEYSVLTIKYARFLHKELKQPDKALRILRNGIKKEKSNVHLYSYVCDICYEKYPTDKKAPLAALELAIACKEFTEEQKLIFLKRKLLFLQEHGDIRRYRSTLGQMIELQEIVRKKETEVLRLKEEEARLRIGINPNLLAFPVPDLNVAMQIDENQIKNNNQNVVPIEFEPVNETQRQKLINKYAAEKETINEIDRPFKKVAPPEELHLSNYGYASKHPDYKLAEYMAQKEYGDLESQGYPEHLKDTEEDRKSRKRKATEDDVQPIYIVQPKSATMYVSSTSIAARNDDSNSEKVPGANPQIIELEAPQRLASITVPSTSPCINVPDWFIKEGGELCLSETKVGFSVLRYWPHFLNDLGQQRMFKAVRRSVKWHQKQRVVYGQWRYIPRLVSWLGPCDWSDKGMELKKNEDWPPEVLDLLHRINQITQHEFNSCFLNLYRTGHDSHPWHGDIHPAYGANPPVATISLGSLRLFEMRRRGPVHNFIRFPMFPGSLLIMEGACQVDWSHQVPKDPKVDGERISLIFRVMHAIETIDSESLPPKPDSEDSTNENNNNMNQNKSPDNDKDKRDEDSSKKSDVEIIQVTEPQSQTSIRFFDREKTNK